VKSLRIISATSTPHFWYSFSTFNLWTWI